MARNAPAVVRSAAGVTAKMRICAWVDSAAENCSDAFTWYCHKTDTALSASELLGQFWDNDRGVIVQSEMKCIFVAAVIAERSANRMTQGSMTQGLMSQNGNRVHNV